MPSPIVSMLVLLAGILLSGCRETPTAHAETRAPLPTSAPPQTLAPGERAREPLSLIPEFPRAAGGPFPFGAQDFSVWRARVPRIEEVEISSSLDGNKQRALFYDPGRPEPRPLLVALHSWSENYLQNIGIPYGIFAERNGWVLIHPDHRGPYRSPTSVASELAQRDVLDAVEYAKRRARIDPARIYLVGYSGSAMTSLVLAGRHPEVWAGVVSWVPIYDLVDWYGWLRANVPDRHYAHEVAAACGGAPRPGTPAEEECRRRSPRSHLKGARGRVNVYLGVGIWDQLVPPDHALRAFNDLAAPADRVRDEDIGRIASTRSIPETLGAPKARPLYEAAKAKVVFERTSERATVVVFLGGHDVIYNAGLSWLGNQRKTVLP
ncbi:alpha/beta fold hydrolase [Polyangium sp. 15x6]|uniref:alpha/beta hydrolase family protein n=1 Tax=Polyangium sp. 15x6 TaxID=3042687 RepID=UPI002499CB70|nr:alpha/beta fold hydrolase [Polyangium sp. 15x6]MDI3289161.1 alpha/beta fold hydrolase [Polyangium sp. 15x6]